MAMAENEKGDTASSEDGVAWGTLEELLLACAISRHGTQSWDSISMELQKRANPGNGIKDGDSFKNTSNAFTPINCEHKYQALKRRFNVTGERNDRTAADEDAEGGRELRQKLSFMVDELRKLRVEELRRQVERHDVSIESLQLKVKKLEDAREKSSSQADQEDIGGADLGKRADRNDSDGQGVRGSADAAGKSDEPEAEDGSFNESNSTSHKGAPSGGRGELDQSREPDPVLPVGDSAQEKDCSSSRGARGGDVGYDLEGEKVVGRRSPPNRLGNSGELRESVSESKRDGKESKQSSDVQSSASLSRRKRRGDGIGSSGDELETEEWSPVNKRKGVKSQPLIKFLEIVRSHKHGLVFQRRLPSQETEKYRNLIRQHMDLETVQSKLERGVYHDNQLKLYRDILLIFSNAVLFFCKSSTENAAARELRKLVIKEIVSQRKPKAAPLASVKPNLEPQILDPVVKKPRSSTNIVLCRRRTNSSTKSKEMEEVKVESLDTKPSVNMKEEDAKNDDSSDEEEQPINKRRKKLVRKQGVVNFLKRMQDSPSKEPGAKPAEDAPEEDGAKKAAETTKKRAVVGKKKDGDDGGAVKTRVMGRRSTTKGEEAESLETMRRGSGRPPARKAATGSATLDSGRVKRRRDGEKEVAGGSGKSTSAAKKSRR